jgi:hypothetical protein
MSHFQNKNVVIKMLIYMWLCVKKNENGVHVELHKCDVWQQSHICNARSDVIIQFIFNCQFLCLLFSSLKTDMIPAICSYPSFTAEFSRALSYSLHTYLAMSPHLYYTMHGGSIFRMFYSWVQKQSHYINLFI